MDTNIPNLGSPQEENFGMGDAAPFEAVGGRTKLLHTEFKLASYNVICSSPITFLLFNTGVDRLVTRGFRKLSNSTPRPAPPRLVTTAHK